MSAKFQPVDTPSNVEGLGCRTGGPGRRTRPNRETKGGTMDRQPFSRRSMLGAGVAAGAAAATVGPAALARATEPPSGDDPRGNVEAVGAFRQSEALSAVLPGEQVIFVAAAAMVPNS